MKIGKWMFLMVVAARESKVERDIRTETGL